MAWIALAVVSCQENHSGDANKGETFDLSAWAGMYSDTIPAPNAVGNVVQLTIHGDSSFSMFQRVLKLDDPVIRPVSTTGRIELMENGKKWKLVPKNTGAAAWMVECGAGELIVLDSLGNRPTDTGKFRLERISSATAQIGRNRLFSIDKGQQRFPLGVYNRPAGDDINVATYYLAACSEAELGLCYYYSRLFEGKLEGQDPIAMAVKKEGNSLRAISERTVIGQDGGPLNATANQNILTSLIFSKAPDAFVVTYTYLDAKDQNWMAKDVYAFKDGKMIQTAKGNVEALNR